MSHLSGKGENQPEVFPSEVRETATTAVLELSRLSGLRGSCLRQTRRVFGRYRESVGSAAGTKNSRTPRPSQDI